MRVEVGDHALGGGEEQAHADRARVGDAFRALAQVAGAAHAGTQPGRGADALPGRVGRGGEGLVGRGSGGGGAQRLGRRGEGVDEGLVAGGGVADPPDRGEAVGDALGVGGGGRAGAGDGGGQRLEQQAEEGTARPADLVEEGGGGGLQGRGRVGVAPGELVEAAEGGVGAER